MVLQALVLHLASALRNLVHLLVLLAPVHTAHLLDPVHMAHLLVPLDPVHTAPLLDLLVDLLANLADRLVLWEAPLLDPVHMAHLLVPLDPVHTAPLLDLLVDLLVDLPANLADLLADRLVLWEAHPVHMALRVLVPPLDQDPPPDRDPPLDRDPLPWVPIKDPLVHLLDQLDQVRLPVRGIIQPRWEDQSTKEYCNLDQYTLKIMKSV